MAKTRLNDTKDESEVTKKETTQTNETKPAEKTEEETASTTETKETTKASQDTEDNSPTPAAEDKPEHIVRMEEEAVDLNGKSTKLKAFINDDPKYKELGRLEQALLSGQLKAMQTYEHMLKQRIQMYSN